MPPNSRQKACIPCADAKRRCDKQMPGCERCLDRDIDCRYPQPKRRRRDRRQELRQSSGIIEQLPDVPDFGDAIHLGNGLEFGNWGIGMQDLDVSLPDMAIPAIPTMASTTPDQQSVPENLSLESRDVMANATCPWFLRDETWALHHASHAPACVSATELEPFVQSVGEMLQTWIKTGSNSFIHSRLYDYDMPTCVQDAFTMMATYLGRTPGMSETILQIADARASELVTQKRPSTHGSSGIKAHLARVHALFVYVYIRLFDGSVRYRASAERQILTLRLWVTQMWEAVKAYRAEDTHLHNLPLHWSANAFDREFDAASDVWRLWILTESLRRTLLVIDTTLNIYKIMTAGWAECDGGVSFTARKGLWEAESAVRWLDMCCEKPPLLVESLQPGQYMSNYRADEFDDFAPFYWSFIVGSDRMKSWQDMGQRTVAV